MVQKLLVGPVLEETVYREGLLAVQHTVGSDGDLAEFPKRANGSTLLLRQSFFERLCSGRLGLADFQPQDIAAAQADIRHLNLSQLLYIRCQSLGPVSSLVPAEVQFMTVVSETLDQQLAKRLATPPGDVCDPVVPLPSAVVDVMSDPRRAAEVVRHTILIYGAWHQLQADADHWLVRVHGAEASLHLPTCTFRPLEGKQPETFCHRSLSSAVGAAPKEKKMLHWQVEIPDDPMLFVASEPQKPRASSERRKRQGQNFVDKISMGASRRANAAFVGDSSKPNGATLGTSDAQIANLQAELRRLEVSLEEEQAQRTSDLAAFQERFKVQLAQNSAKCDRLLSEHKAESARANLLAAQLAEQEASTVASAAQLTGQEIEKEERATALAAQLAEYEARLSAHAVELAERDASARAALAAQTGHEERANALAAQLVEHEERASAYAAEVAERDASAGTARGAQDEQEERATALAAQLADHELRAGALAAELAERDAGASTAPETRNAEQEALAAMLTEQEANVSALEAKLTEQEARAREAMAAQFAEQQEHRARADALAAELAEQEAHASAMAARFKEQEAGASDARETQEVSASSAVVVQLTEQEEGADALAAQLTQQEASASSALAAQFTDSEARANALAAEFAEQEEQHGVKLAEKECSFRALAAEFAEQEEEHVVKLPQRECSFRAFEERLAEQWGADPGSSRASTKANAFELEAQLTEKEDKSSALAAELKGHEEPAKQLAEQDRHVRKVDACFAEQHPASDEVRGEESPHAEVMVPTKESQAFSECITEPAGAQTQAHEKEHVETKTAHE